MGNPTIWSIVWWIGAGVFFFFTAVAASPIGKELPQRGQGIAMFALIGLLLTGVGYMATGPRVPTPEDEVAAKHQADIREVERQSENVAAFPDVASELMSKLEGLEVQDVSTLDSATDTIRFFDLVAMNIRIIERAVSEGRVDVPAETVAAKDRLKVLLIRKQTQLFPAMRNTYAAYMSRAVASTQANFRAVGPKNKTLRAASPNFTSRDVVMESHSLVISHATRFRFTRAEYVYSFGGNFDYFTIHGDADYDIGG
ncbi:MAG: hypothetical protein Q8S53_07500 [Brevundimonas sp.]|uniref:hypothetical protein n=1 Tax=Brevundimonas sp. TaxID=1871086 RepID=UPI002732B450|nr:hypothetical protein [Brevundimonas sp.]MDP3378196.1 hypothetical protein [Brevundimonas sp.]